MEQVTIIGVGWAVGEGTMLKPQDSGKPEEVDARVLVFRDVQFGRIYQFPLEHDEANRLGKALQGIAEEEKPDLVIPDGPLSEEQLRRMSEPERMAREAAGK